MRVTLENQLNPVEPHYRGAGRHFNKNLGARSAVSHLPERSYEPTVSLSAHGIETRANRGLAVEA